MLIVLLAPFLLTACTTSSRTTPTPRATVTATATTAATLPDTVTATATTAATAGVVPPSSNPANPTPRPTLTPTIPRPPTSTATPAPIGLTEPGFGMTMHFMWYDIGRTTKELDQIRASGLTVARFDVGWRWVEPQSKGSYDITYLTKLDAILQEMDARGIRPIITVIETPAWARGPKTGIFAPPSNLQDYADIMGVLARRYADRPNMVWEVWNEPNLLEFWEPAPNAAAYTDMLRRAYKAIKAESPDTTVLGGAIVFNDLKFLNAMYAAGAAGSFDGLSLHPYAPGRSPDDRRDPFTSFNAVPEMKAVMNAHGESSKTIWITEMGWELDMVTDETRGKYLARAVELVRGWSYVRAFCVYTLGQDLAPDGNRFGLIGGNGTPSVSWISYTSAAR